MMRKCKIENSITLTLVLVGLISSGCAATVHRAGKPSYSGRIESSSHESLKIQGDNSEYFEIACSEVRDIDHPGNVLTIVGAAIASTGLMTAASVAANDGSPVLTSSDALVIGGIGGVLMAAGLIPYALSRSATSECVVSGADSTQGHL